jgi:PAS domain S-box-containing protein
MIDPISNGRDDRNTGANVAQTEKQRPVAADVVKSVPGDCRNARGAGRPSVDATRAIALGAGALVALVSAWHLVAWLTGVMAQRGFNHITMKANTALCLLLLGTSLVIIAARDTGVARRATRVCAALALLIGLLTLFENLFSWNLGIDQIIAKEPPGTLGMVQPNRVGTPASIGIILLSLALFFHSRPDLRAIRLAQTMASVATLIGLLTTIGYIYDAQWLYGVAGVTAIAWPTAASLLLLGLGVLCARPAEGFMAQVTAADPGGAAIRRLLPVLLAPVGLGWLRLVGERSGMFDTAMGTALVMVIIIVVLAGATYLVGWQVSQSAAEVQRQRTMLAVTLASIGDAVITTDAKGRVNFLNPVGAGLTGWTHQEAWSQPIQSVFKIVNEKTGALLENIAVRVLREGQVLGLANHTALVTRDGRTIPIEDSAAPIKDSAGEVVGVVLVFHDVTGKRRAQEALHESEERYRLLSDTAGQLLAVENPQTVVNELCQKVMDHLGCDAFFNFLVDDSADRLALNACTGIPPAEIRKLQWLDYGTAVCGCVARDKQRIIAEDIPNTSDSRTELVKSYGIQAYCCHPLIVQGRLIGTPSFGTRTRAHFSAQDVETMRTVADQVATAMERMHAQQALRVANEQLVEADRRKNDFLAMLSHELRNPLAPIRNSLYIIERVAPDSDQARRALTVIGRQVEHLSHLVDDLLDVTRISRNKVRLECQVLEFNDLVYRAVEDHRPLFDKNEVQVEVRLAPERVHVNADGIRLMQVIGNLLQNAAKFTGRGGRVTVSVSIDPTERRATVSVSDTGVGISSELLGRLFQPFMQADSTLDRSKGGLGLGLALVKGLVELHGGDVRVQSDGPGKGAEFIVRLPLSLDGVAAVEASATRVHRAGRRVLIIEDNIDAADSLREALEFGNHTVEVAYNGPDGLAIARHFSPEVVLCDIGLPDMNGFEGARAFRADNALKNAFLVALSGYALPEDMQRTSEAGFEKHLAKPPSLDKLEELLAQVPAASPQQPASDQMGEASEP